MKKAHFLSALFLFLLMISALFSCNNAENVTQPNNVPYYETDYIYDELKQISYLGPNEIIGNIIDVIDRAEIIANIKILGLSKVYTDQMIPLSVYVGEILEPMKGEFSKGKYIYISRPGSFSFAIKDLSILKPGDQMILFLKHDEINTRCNEQPLYCGCYNGFFENLYVYETNGKKYVLPDTLEDFIPQEIQPLSDDMTNSLNAIIYRRNNKVYDYDTIKNYIMQVIK